MGLLTYNGNNKIIKRICQLLNVVDVQDGEGHSLVGSDGIAIVTGGGGGSSTLAGLTDVNLTSPSDYQALVYDDTDDLWKNASLSIPGSLNDLSDVNISSPSNGQVLKYNSTSSKWQNTDASWLSLASGGTVKGDTTFRKSNLTADAQIVLTVGGKNSSSDTYGTDGIFTLANKSGSRIILYPPSGSFNYRQIYFPNKSGTIAMATDIPSDFVPASTGGTFEGDVIIDEKDGTTTTEGKSILTLGNNIPEGTDENSTGAIRLFTGMANSGQQTATVIDLVPLKNSAIYLQTKGNLRIDREHGTANSAEAYSILEVGNNVANTQDGHSEGLLRIWDINGNRHTIYPPELSSGKAQGNANYRLSGAGGYFVMSADVYVDDIPAYTPSGGTAYNAAQMVLYAHANILKDNQKICAKVGYGTNDMFVMGYRRQESRGRYIFMTRTNDAVFSLRVSGSKAATYVQLDMGSGTNITID